MNYYVPSGVQSIWFINGATGVVADEFQPPVPDGHPLEDLMFCVFGTNDDYVIGYSADNDKNEAYEEALKLYLKDQA